LTIFPGYFFGDIAYHSALLASDNAVIDLHENYIKQSQRNHTIISGPNGLIKLTLSIHKPSGVDRSSGNIRIDHSENFKREHLNSIKTAYSPSPFFESFFPKLEVFYSQQHTTLREAHKASIALVNDVVQIDKPWDYSEQYFQANEHDLDLRIKKNVPLYPNKTYSQVFQEKQGFLPNLSILDLIFNEGKWARKYLIENSN